MPLLLPNIAAENSLDSLRVPTHADGSWYRFEMICDGGWSRVYDDSPEGLLQHLIPGYESFSAEEQITARIAHAVDMQVRLQARLNVFFSGTPCTESELRVLTGPRHQQPSIDNWACAIPLVLVDAFYAPYTEEILPSSSAGDVAESPNLWWLRPAQSPFEYLRSLHETSVIDLNICRDEVI